MSRLLALVALIFLLAGCAYEHPMAPCPNPDPDPISACATSHSNTYDSGGRW